MLAKICIHYLHTWSWWRWHHFVFDMFCRISELEANKCDFIEAGCKFILCFSSNLNGNFLLASQNVYTAFAGISWHSLWLRLHLIQSKVKAIRCATMTSQLFILGSLMVQTATISIINILKTLFQVQIFTRLLCNLFLSSVKNKHSSGL